MKKFSPAEIEVIRFTGNDVIATSGGLLSVTLGGIDNKSRNFTISVGNNAYKGANTSDAFNFLSSYYSNVFKDDWTAQSVVFYVGQKNKTLDVLIQNEVDEESKYSIYNGEYVWKVDHFVKQ